MSEPKHERLERLKELLNFTDGGHWDQYCNGYRQAEIDSGNALVNLDQKLGMELSAAQSKITELEKERDRFKEALENIGAVNFPDKDIRACGGDGFVSDAMIAREALRGSDEYWPPRRFVELGAEHSLFAESMEHPDIPDCVEFLSVAEHEALLEAAKRGARAEAFSKAWTITGDKEILRLLEQAEASAAPTPREGEKS